MNGTSNGHSPSDILSRKPGNVAVRTNPSHDLWLHRTPAPDPSNLKPGECLVHVRATGICGSDVHFWKHGAIGPMVVTCDHGLGHESAGDVIAVGSGVTAFKPGDRVAIECGVPCMKATCDACRMGKYNFCPEVVFYSTPPHHGTLTRYHVHPQEWLHKIPDSLSYEQGSLLEPLSVALAGVERSGVRLGDAVVVCGAGPIGITTLLAVAAAGAEPIVITDINEQRLETAKKLVPRVRTVAIGMGKTPEECGAEVKKALGKEAMLVMECTGVQSSVQTGIFSCAYGATVFIIGCGKDFQEVPFMHLSANEIDLRFQYRYHDTYPRAISLVESGVIDVKSLVTHRFSLEEGIEAFKAASDPKAMALKVQILDD